MIIEVSVQRFYTSEQGIDVAPKAVFVIEHDKLVSTNWEALATALGESIKDIPVPGLREMTADEIREYRKAEDEE